MNNYIEFKLGKNKNIITIEDNSDLLINKVNLGDSINKFLYGKSDKNIMDLLVKKCFAENRIYKMVPVYSYFDQVRYYTELNINTFGKEVLCRFNLFSENNVPLENLRNLEQISAGTAHKINNFLTPISGSYQILKMNINDDTINSEDLKNSMMKYLEILNTSIIKMTDLTKDLTRFSYELHSPKRIPVSFNEIFKDISKNITQECGNRKLILKFTNSIEENIYLLDPLSIKSIVNRVMENCYDTLEVGGEILIEAEETESTLSMIISDNGAGMDEDLHKRVTDPFATTKKSGKGIGVGLTSVEKMLEISKGHFKIIKNEPRGIKVILTWNKLFN